MGHPATELESRIRRTEADLNKNLQALERKAKDAIDWHYHFEKHSWGFLVGAFGVGVLTSLLFDRSPGREYVVRDTPRVTLAQPNSPTAWDHVRAALIGVAATRITQYVEGVIPGFTQEFRKAQTRS